MKIICKTAGVLLITAVLLTGCQGSKEKYTFRETGIEQLNAGQYDEAVQSFDQALEHSDGTVGVFELDVLKYRAEAEYEAGDYDASAHTYGILMQVEEEKPEYLARRCILSIKAGKPDQAAEDYQKLYEQNPGVTVTEPVLLALGQAYSEAERFDEAMALYQTAAADGLQSSELYNRMGLCEMDAGDYDQALDYFDQGIQAGAEGVQPKLLYNKAAAYEQKLDFEKALELLESYVDRYGSTEEVEKEIAFLKTRQGAPANGRID